MTEVELAIHEANIEKYGPLPLPMWFRDGPKGADGRPLDPTRRRIAVYPDGTFPIKTDESNRPKR